MNNESTIAGPNYKGAMALNYTSTSASAAAIPNQNTAVRLVSTSDCFINITQTGAVALAGAGSMFLPANTVEYVLAPQGSIISAIQSSVVGTLYITPCQ